MAMPPRHLRVDLLQGRQGKRIDYRQGQGSQGPECPHAAAVSLVQFSLFRAARYYTVWNQ